MFEGIIEKKPDKILEGWCNYFTSLYMPSNDSNFDDSFKRETERKLNEILLENEDEHTSK